MSTRISLTNALTIKPFRHVQTHCDVSVKSKISRTKLTLRLQGRFVIVEGLINKTTLLGSQAGESMNAYGRDFNCCRHLCGIFAMHLSVATVGCDDKASSRASSGTGVVHARDPSSCRQSMR